MTTIDNYKLLNTLGSGAYSKVKLAKDGEGNKVALKVMKGDSDKTKEQDKQVFFNEVRAMKELKHPNILKIVDSSEKSYAKRPDGTSLKVKYIALEYAEGGELFDYIAETGCFSEAETRYFYHQLIDALEYIHENGYRHRDIKPENLLLDKDFNLKIADFGFATKEDVSHIRKGTFGYMAPECLAQDSYRGVEADLFATAIVMFILITQHPPFIRADPTDRYYKKVWSGNWEQFWDVHSDQEISESFMDLFMKMVSVEPEDRLTLKEIKEHEWFKLPVPSKDDIVKEFTKRKLMLKKKVSAKKAKEDKESDKKVKKVRSAKKQKVVIKFTKFFDITDPEQLIEAVVDCAQKSGVKFKKSKEYFRVELKMEKALENVSVIVNVLKKPENDMRCLEFVKMSGEKKDFDSLFANFKKFCTEKFE